MDKIIVDANFIVALLDTNDSCHKQATDIAEKVRDGLYKVIINNLVVYEIVTVLSMKGFKEKALWFYETLCQDRWMQVIYIDESLEKRACEYFKKAPSKNVSFADCTIFGVVDMYDIGFILSFDKHLCYTNRATVVTDAEQLR